MPAWQWVASWMAASWHAGSWSPGSAWSHRPRLSSCFHRPTWESWIFPLCFTLSAFFPYPFSLLLLFLSPRS
jgi:hypothetical protein